jgi:hypothetical protein
MIKFITTPFLFRASTVSIDLVGMYSVLDEPILFGNLSGAALHPKLTSS